MKKLDDMGTIGGEALYGGYRCSMFPEFQVVISESMKWFLCDVLPGMVRDETVTLQEAQFTETTTALIHGWIWVDQPENNMMMEYD